MPLTGLSQPDHPYSANRSSPCSQGSRPARAFFLRSSAPLQVRRNWLPRERLRPVLLFRSGPYGCGFRRSASSERHQGRGGRGPRDEKEKTNDLPDELRPTSRPVDQGTQRTVQDGAQGDYLDPALHSRTRRSRRRNAPDRRSHRIQGCTDARLRPGTSPDQNAEAGALSPGSLTWVHQSIRDRLGSPYNSRSKQSQASKLETCRIVTQGILGTT